MVTLEELKSIFNYNPVTGIFTYLISPRNGIKIGDIAGNLNQIGYVILTIRKKRYGAHRLAWLYMTGEWPKEMIDHKDGVRSNNKFENLREATNQQNQFNSKSHIDNKIGFKGVTKTYKGYRAQIKINNTLFHIGIFDTPEEAAKAYKNKAEEIQGEYAISYPEIRGAEW